MATHPDEIFNVICLEGALTCTDCAAILELAAEHEFTEGQVASGDGTYIDLQYRKSTQALIEQSDESGWVYTKLQRLVGEANKIYKFDLQGMEMLQVAEYRPREYYKSHMDLGPGMAKFRKLSVVVQLTDPREYTGGELLCHQPSVVCPKARGTVLIFPSFVHHEVMPVTSGIRHSLAGWFTGSRFH